MKKYIAVANCGNHNSGNLPKTHEECVEWAKKILGTHKNVTQIVICEIISLVEATDPPVKIKDFEMIEIVDESIPRAA